MTSENYMIRAFELAIKGKGKVSPNPMVGCVIVHQGKIIGEGWHKKYGEVHAEVNAINSLSDKAILPHCEVYVSLEPCAHFGKTPPCADLLIKHQVQKVIISVADPNPLVGGKGIARMREAGIEVVTGILEVEGFSLNKRFFKAIQQKRPFVILKWAETADKFIARKNYDSKWISSPYSRKLVHKWRTEEDAILVGSKTAEYDNPQLTAREWNGKNPLRVVIDRNLKLSSSLYLFDGAHPTICYNLIKNSDAKNLTFVTLENANFIEEMLDDLSKRGVQSIIVEGGATILNEFIKKQLWDEIRLFKAGKEFGEGIASPEEPKMSFTETILPEGDRLRIYLNRYPVVRT